MSETLGWLIDWFEERGALPSGRDGEPLEVNYFEAGLIDSLSAIRLISDLEGQFDIRFDQEHFLDRRFQTIAGLREIVDELRNHRG